MAPSQLQLNRGREYSTIHGDRPVGDLHANVHFYQDGLPFDAQGNVVADHPDVTADTPAAKKLREVLDRKLKKLNKGKRVAGPDVTAAGAEGQPSSDDDHPIAGEAALSDADEDDEAEDDLEAPIDLRKWLTGEQSVVWNDISQAIALKYKKRVGNKKDAVEFLMEQGICNPNVLAPEFKKLIG